MGLSWPTSSKLRSRPTRSRLRRLRRLLPSTWPSSARLNKSLRRLKRGQSLLKANFLLSAKDLCSKHHQIHIIEQSRESLEELFERSIALKCGGWFAFVVKVILSRVHQNAFIDKD